MLRKRNSMDQAEQLRNIIKKENTKIKIIPKFLLYCIISKLKTKPIPINNPKAFLLSKVPVIPVPKITSGVLTTS